MHFPGKRAIATKPQAKEGIAVPVPQFHSVLWLSVTERNGRITSSLSESFLCVSSPLFPIISCLSLEMKLYILVSADLFGLIQNNIFALVKTIKLKKYTFC